ncbi:alkylation response protein AidB-like acyl-CoA dehydrogenase [Saccharomonospora amisosensis]|uniref:Alkylation response protein AidB-like acyl-CoA dehydrogenase n=1 Tax=Saccharomonospora amisosensis TaxID=1128677 RepID=A0A7X5ZRG0_9PSEU|nr:acyl-CoA dehydrogenase family protein [Saccharomonospora amisosensis]NIJ12491.1 alkylation response protein AidB-like acyl-CoA dehydrogenase [Saccharomonospora amisosensis]
MNAATEKLFPLLEPVLALARRHASEVDGEARFPTESVLALRESGLLGLTVPAESGGLGCGPLEFAEVVSALAAECGSTAMIYLMHVSATMPLARAAPAAMPGLLSDVATGKVLASLALSERGSRSHFWAPVSRAVAKGGMLRVRAEKSWVTSAGHADIYVASTLTEGADTVDLVTIPATTPGVTVSGDWHGLGLRGNASAPVTLDVELPSTARLGGAGGGFELLMETVLPWFNLGNAAVSTGLARAATDAAITHATAATFEHLEQSLSALPTIRAQLARMSIEVTGMRAMLRQTADALARQGEDTMLHVLGSKAAANDAALRVTDAAMRVCGGAAFSQHLGIDRYFRDARAGHVMAPTADALYDFYGKAVTGQPLF